MNLRAWSRRGATDRTELALGFATLLVIAAMFVVTAMSGHLLHDNDGTSRRPSPVAHANVVPAKVRHRYHVVARHRARRLVRAHAASPAGPQPCSGPGTISAAQSYYGFGYLANQIASAYQLTPFYEHGDEGQGQTIALLELEPDSANDIAAYQGCYGTNTTVNYTAVDGGVNGNGVDTTDPGTGEAALDIEQIIGLAPRATIDVYQAPNTQAGILDAYRQMVANPAVTIISTSWGACETDNPLPALEQPIFQTAANDGISVLAAAGDSGSTDCGTSALAVDDPASQPAVTGVGGTTLPNIDAVSQQFAWNGSSISSGVTGGGFSALWPEPSYQQAAANAPEASAATAGELACPAAADGGYCRGVPDVSADADPYTGYIIYLTQNGKLTAAPYGGTSAAAPLWAALTALINASPACNAHNLGQLNPLLYQVAVKGMPGLTNITTGNNDDSADNPVAYFTARQGFSPVTGLGTPDGSLLAQSLCAQADTLTLTAPSSQASSYGQPVDLTSIAATDAQGHALTYAAVGLPAGLSINPQTGAVTGTPAADAQATVRVTVTAADNDATQTRIISWTVTGAPAPPAATPSTPLPPPSTTTPTTGSQHHGDPTTSDSRRVVHLTARYHSQVVRITLTLASVRGRRHLLVAYATTARRSRARLLDVQLVVRRLSRAGRNAHRTRLSVLGSSHGVDGEIIVALRSSPNTVRGLALVLRYSRASVHMLDLPSL